MALWMVRAGSSGEHEGSFIEKNIIALTWGEPMGDRALRDATSKDAIYALLAQRYPGKSGQTLGGWAGTMARLRFDMKPGDLIVTPRKASGGGYSIARVLSDYEYRHDEASPDARHIRRVEWLSGSDPIPRDRLSSDILLSLGARTTIYRVSRNDAEARFRAFVESKFATFPTLAPDAPKVTSNEVPGSETEQEELDFEEIAADRIARHIAALYSNHGPATLVEAVLQAQGYTTYKSPPGPDGGMDLLASGGPLGFGAPRILVQVKSGSSLVDHPVYTHMIGAMTHYGADQGLLVSWGGFKKTVTDEAKKSFFRVRLWGRDDLISAFLEHYDHLPAEIRANVPLKRIWTLTLGEPL